DSAKQSSVPLQVMKRLCERSTRPKRAPSRRHSCQTDSAIEQSSNTAPSASTASNRTPERSRPTYRPRARETWLTTPDCARRARVSVSTLGMVGSGMAVLLQQPAGSQQGVPHLQRAHVGRAGLHGMQVGSGHVDTLQERIIERSLHQVALLPVRILYAAILEYRALRAHASRLRAAQIAGKNHPVAQVGFLPVAA